MNVTINGFDIHYTVQGEGKSVLMLHGWMGQIDSFAPVIQELQKHRKVYAIDFPGQGGASSAPTEPMNMDDYVDIVVQFIRQMGISGTDIVNHSFGGRVSIILAAKHPELVGKIVFTDAAGIRPKRTFKYYVKVYTYKFCKWAAKHDFVKKILRVFGSDVEKRIKNAGSDDYKQLSGVMRPTFSNVVNEDLTHYLKHIKAPSLLIYGRQDTSTPVYMGEIMEKNIPDAGLIVLENAGHFAYLDQFPQYIAIVKNFLGVDG